MIETDSLDMVTQTHGRCRLVASLDETRRCALAHIRVEAVSTGETLVDLSVEELETVFRIAETLERGLTDAAIERRAAPATRLGRMVDRARALAEAHGAAAPTGGSAA